jgi:hypothetical protein
MTRLGVSAAGFAALTGATIGFVRVVADEWAGATGAGRTRPGATSGGTGASGVRVGDLAPDQILVLGAAGVALLLAGWLILGTVAAVAAHLPGRVGRLGRWIAEHWAPALSRRIAAALVGAATLGSLTPAAGIAASSPPATTPSTATAPAAATAAIPIRDPGFTISEPSPSATPEPVGQADSPGWVPSRPMVAQAPSPRLLTSTPGPASSSGEVVVHRGDTLWGIARLRLGPGASDAEVARAWPRWYAANREVIGADPGHLLPGQILVAPAPLAPVTPATDRRAHR